MSPSSSAELVNEKFTTLISISTPFQTRPDAEQVTQMKQSIANVLHAIPWMTNHNLVGLVSSSTEYRRIYNPNQDCPKLKQFSFSPRPGPCDPSINANTPAWEVEMKRDLWKAKLAEWDAYVAADAAIKEYLMHMIPEPYYVSLKDAATEYRCVFASDFFKYISDEYGQIEETDAIHIQPKIVAQNIDNDDIPTYTATIDNLSQKAQLAGVPVSEYILHSSAYAAALRSPYYGDAQVTTTWKNTPLQQKTWALWKRLYHTEHSNRLKADRANANHSGGHSATPPSAYHAAPSYPSSVSIDGASNPGTELFAASVTSALDNLASAATADRTSFNNLVTRNEQLSTKNDELTSVLTKLQKDFAALKASGNTSPQIEFEPNGYCWSHGYKLKKGHSSSTCRRRAEGHIVTATRCDTKGGSDKNKGWDF